MLILGEFNTLPIFDKGDFLVYNLSSMREGFAPVQILPQITEMNYLDERQFDIAFYNFIFNNDLVFYEFFDKIVYKLYAGFNIFLLVSRNEFFDAISESLIKLIQQRYGFNAAIINEVSDFDYINQDETINVTGVYNLDLDKNRYVELYAKRNAAHINPNGQLDGKQEFI